MCVCVCWVQGFAGFGGSGLMSNGVLGFGQSTGYWGIRCFSFRSREICIWNWGAGGRRRFGAAGVASGPRFGVCGGGLVFSKCQGLCVCI